MKPQIPWLRVFVEGVVIVGSILLAFGLQAWWEGRQEAELERVYLEQLLSDLVRAEVQLTPAAAVAEVASQSVLMVIAASTATEPPPSDSIAAWLNGAGPIPDALPTYATAQGLVSSDGLRVLQSESVRRGVVDLLDWMRQYEVRVLSYEERIQDAWERMNRILPALARGKPRRVGSFGNPPDSLTRQTSVSWSTITDLRPLLGDPDFMASVDDLYQARENFRFIVQAMLNQTRMFNAVIEAELR